MVVEGPGQPVGLATDVVDHRSGGVEQVDADDVGRIQNDLPGEDPEPLAALALGSRGGDELSLVVHEGEAVAEEALEEGVGLERLGPRFVDVLANEKAVEVFEPGEADDNDSGQRKAPEERTNPELRVVLSRRRQRHDSGRAE
jgi:hypothetical protein